VTLARASTRHPERLAPPAALLRLTRALSVLDEVFWPEWDERCYSLDRERDGTCLARMRNGEGDLWYVVFLPNGAAVLRGFDHNSVMSPYRHDDERLWPGLFEGMPRPLEPWKNAADIEPNEVTFVLWHLPRARWHAGPSHSRRQRPPRAPTGYSSYWTETLPPMLPTAADRTVPNLRRCCRTGSLLDSMRIQSGPSTEQEESQRGFRSSDRGSQRPG
jgi:hypothetical protein